MYNPHLLDFLKLICLCFLHGAVVKLKLVSSSHCYIQCVVKEKAGWKHRRGSNKNIQTL